MYAEKLIRYIESSYVEIDVSWNVDSLRSLVNKCQTTDQLDSTFKELTPLAVACQSECELAVKLLVEAGASVDLPCGDFERSPLHFCMLIVKEKLGTSVAMATILLDHGANVDKRDIRDSTPLHLACEVKNLHRAELLIRNGAMLEAVNDRYETTLVKACWPMSPFSGYTITQGKLIEIIVAAGCDISHNNGHALKLLVINKDVSVKPIKLLISKGADLTLQPYLCIACAHISNKEVIEYLVSNGVDVNQSRNIKNCTALHHVCGSLKVGSDMIDMLLQLGAEINMVTSRGDSALHYACGAANFYKVSALLNWGADPNLVNDDKLTPLATCCCPNCLWEFASVT